MPVASSRVPGLCALLMVLLCFLLPDGVALSADPQAAGARLPPVTVDTVRAKIKESADYTEIDEVARNKLIERYRKTLSFLETAEANQATTDSYRKSRKTAPDEARKLSDKLEAVLKTEAEIEIKVTDTSPLEAINQELISEKANLAAVSAKLTQIESELATEVERPSKARNRIGEIKRRLEELAASGQTPAPEGESVRDAEARNWLLEAEKYTLDTEILMLDQELLSQQARIELLQAQRDYSANSLARIQVRVTRLETLLSGRRVAEAEQARSEAREAKREVEGKHPLLQQLARQNIELGEKIAATASALDKVNAEDDQARSLAKRVSDDARRTRQKLDIAGLNQALGEVMLKQARLLPDEREFRKKARVLEDAISEVSLRQLLLEEEQRSIRNTDAYLDEYLARTDPEEAAGIRSDLEVLAGNRASLLDKAVATSRDYLAALGELDFALTNLQDTVESYSEFLSERLLWVRSVRQPGLETLQHIPVDIAHLLSPGNWLGVVDNLTSPSVAMPLLVLALIVAVVFVIRGRRLYHRLIQTGREVGKPLTDRFGFTLRAMSYSMLIAAVWPLLIAVTGWQLSATLETTEFSGAVSAGLLWLAPTLFFLRLFRVMCIKRGVAEVHFRWSSHSIEILQREFTRLIIVYLPAGFIAITLVNYDEHAVTGAVGRLALIVVQISLAVFFYHLFEPHKGVLKWYYTRHSNSLLNRMRYLIFATAIVVPVILVILSVAGYLYTAGTLTAVLARTLWLVIALITIHQLILRWLLMTQRSLAYHAALDQYRSEQAAREARAAAETGGEAEAEHFEEPQVDLVSLSMESRKLLNLAVMILGAIGIYIIWSRLLPALGILDEITLWHHMGISDGEEQLLPITLADIGMALLILTIVVVATKRFPAFLEMVLLQRLRMTSGGRYTATTLSRYIIIASGVFIVASMLGGSWSQIQWLVAALGVGIGFGLQEIVANFICGLIILFERPIRVGDRVVIGDVEGFVTRIQIRATTIQTFDRAELLVPNKEFITGRLINMSLSDTINRLVIPVGVAYGSDVSRAMDLIIEAASEHERVLEDPKPFVAFESFGDNSLLLTLRCFLDSLEFRLATISELHEMINDKLNAAGIVIAFPQRDLHIDTLSPLDIRIHNAPSNPAGSA